jgi:hypothetical protein
MKTTDMIEGPEAWQRFQAGMKKALAVPHAELRRRIDEQRAKAAKNPNRRGPKRKVKPFASPGPLV